MQSVVKQQFPSLSNFAFKLNLDIKVELLEHCIKVNPDQLWTVRKKELERLSFSVTLWPSVKAKATEEI